MEQQYFALMSRKYRFFLWGENNAHENVQWMHFTIMIVNECWIWTNNVYTNTHIHRHTSFPYADLRYSQRTMGFFFIHVRCLFVLRFAFALCRLFNVQSLPSSALMMQITVQFIFVCTLYSGTCAHTLRTHTLQTKPITFAHYTSPWINTHLTWICTFASHLVIDIIECWCSAMLALLYTLSFSFFIFRSFAFSTRYMRILSSFLAKSFCFYSEIIHWCEWMWNALGCVCGKSSDSNNIHIVRRYNLWCI